MLWGFAALVPCNVQAAKMDLVRYVNPFCGTQGEGYLFPGASMPFGMIQWSPDTGPIKTPGGYNYQDTLIYGFSFVHLSGGGSYYGSDFNFTPLPDAGKIDLPVRRTSFPESFSHKDESAHPGYYSVQLNNGIGVQLTVTKRAGLGRFDFPAKATPTIVINAGSNVNGTSAASVEIDPSAQSVSGSATGGHFLGHSDVRTIYFYAVFSRRFEDYGTWSDSTNLRGHASAEGKTAGAYVTFPATAHGRAETGGVVFVKVAISYVSVAGARMNLESELRTGFSSRAFHLTVSDASEIWNSWLNKIDVSGGTMADRRTFYTMLYHALLAPNVCSDVNGWYMGYDGKIHKTPKGHDVYADFSGWDIYRCECQFLAMLAPNEASDMAQSLFLYYEQGGTFPRWPVVGMDSGVMLGDPAAPMIADFYSFGARDFDVKAALAGLVRAATDTSVYAPRSGTYERNGLSSYLKYGYVPEYRGQQYMYYAIYASVSVTLEYATDDFSVAQLAKALGDDADYHLLMKHSMNWKNLYNQETGYIQMKRRDGSWAPGFADNILKYDNAQAYDEGTASQYVWLVPFDLKGLAEKMGGLKIAAARLDTFFTKLNAGMDSRYAYLGNEPCLETPWIFDFLGEPYKTEKIVREAVRTLYSYKPNGYPGNDDLGEMSSWYIWGALGMYPEVPGNDCLVLGSPLFSKTILHLKNGDVTILGDGASDDAPYVKRLKVDGRTWSKPWIRFSDIAHGATLTYDLGPKPNKVWGSTKEDAPPSYQ